MEISSEFVQEVPDNMSLINYEINRLCDSGRRLGRVETRVGWTLTFCDGSVMDNVNKRERCSKRALCRFGVTMGKDQE